MMVKTVYNLTSENENIVNEINKMLPEPSCFKSDSEINNFSKRYDLISSLKLDYYISNTIERISDFPVSKNDEMGTGMGYSNEKVKPGEMATDVSFLRKQYVKKYSSESFPSLETDEIKEMSNVLKSLKKELSDQFKEKELESESYNERRYFKGDQIISKNTVGLPEYEINLNIKGRVFVNEISHHFEHDKPKPGDSVNIKMANTIILLDKIDGPQIVSDYSLDSDVENIEQKKAKFMNLFVDNSTISRMEIEKLFDLEKNEIYQEKLTNNSILREKYNFSWNTEFIKSTTLNEDNLRYGEINLLLRNSLHLIHVIMARFRNDIVSADYSHFPRGMIKKIGENYVRLLKDCDVDKIVGCNLSEDEDIDRILRLVDAKKINKSHLKMRSANEILLNLFLSEILINYELIQSKGEKTTYYLKIMKLILRSISKTSEIFWTNEKYVQAVSEILRAKKEAAKPVLTSEESDLKSIFRNLKIRDIEEEQQTPIEEDEETKIVEEYEDEDNPGEFGGETEENDDDDGIN
jgi:hypothetical protein